MRQIAALPYRVTPRGTDNIVEILLVTSRETKRWVLPKGNPVGGLSPHAAAAHEAEEEAGVLGSASPLALGQYRYRKRRSNGAQLMFDVTVFPMAVTTELEEWAEQAERERKWFTLAEAADNVDEPDLGELIRRFRASEMTNTSSGLMPPVVKSGSSKMFGWFQRLLPEKGEFFELFEAHSLILVAGSDALARLMQGSGVKDHVKEIAEREHDADDITREVLQTVRRTFLTPFDRSAITALIGSMDDAIDQMNQTAGAVDLYEFRAFDQGMRDMAAIIVDCARVTAEAVPLLRNVGKNAKRLHELTERLVKLEGQADGIHTEGVKALFKEQGEKNTLHFIVAREIYTHLERVADKFEDVANEIDGLVIDHA